MKQFALLAMLVLWFAAETTPARAQTNTATLTLDEKTLALVRQLAADRTNAQPVRLDDQTRRLLQNSLEEHWFKKDAFFSTVLGGFLAVAGGLAASWFAHHLEAKHKRTGDAQFTTNVLTAIRQELEALTTIYAQGMGKILASWTAGQPLDVRLAITQDWFTVFTANAAELGRIEPAISKKIISVYALIKFLIEEYKINNDYLAVRDQLDFQVLLRPTEQDLRTRRQITYGHMVAQAARIKEGDALLKSTVAELFQVLTDRGIN